MSGQQFNGKRAEYLVLAKLLEMKIEAYPAISFLQEDYDITVILKNGANINVKRIQVKSTELQNDSKNNSIEFRLPLGFDFLVLVVFDTDDIKYYILTKDELQPLLNTTNKLYISRMQSSVYVVRNNLNSFHNQWNTILASLAM